LARLPAPGLTAGRIKDEGGERWMVVSRMRGVGRSYQGGGVWALDGRIKDEGGERWMVVSRRGCVGVGWSYKCGGGRKSCWPVVSFII
jgi:hypothetical protein